MGRPGAPLYDWIGAASPQECTHLVLMLHGVNGQPSDFGAVVKALQTAKATNTGTLVVRPHVTKLSCQGVEPPAREVYSVVKDVLEMCGGLRECSMLCLSFGGLYGRFLAKLLAEDGMLGSAESGAQLRADTFLTVASPHLGVRRFATSGFHGFFDTAFHTFAPKVAGFTGTQLLLEDGEQMLHQMVDEEYLSCLRSFDRRVCYANTQHDPQVPAWTGNIESNEPFDFSSLPCLDEYPNILDTHSLQESFSAKKAAPPVYAQDQKATILDGMRQKLDGLGWEKIWVRLPALPNAHNQIIGMMPGERGKDVARHIALQLVR